jgi:hypothetical protein
MNDNQRIPDAWHGWHFEDSRLIDPAGNAFTSLAIQACHYLRQLPGFAEALRPPEQTDTLN